ncbi:MAG TPA: glycosyltransferase, partial [Opitutales bacterium]|nr:glycosyltransferase [Opitutales bacterium]
IDEAIEASPYKKSIRVLGFIHSEELPFWYAGSIGLVFPSLVEGFGFAVVEAQACGTLVVSSNRTSLTEVAGPATLLFDPKNIKAIESALEQLAFMPNDERKALIEESIAWAQQFDWDRVAAQVVEVYNELLNPSDASAIEPSPDLATQHTEVNRTAP